MIPTWIASVAPRAAHRTMLKTWPWTALYAKIQSLQTSSEVLSALHCELTGKSRKLVVSRLYTRYRALRTAEHYEDLKPFIGKLPRSSKQNVPVLFP